jgi:hypothetical protein
VLIIENLYFLSQKYGACRRGKQCFGSHNIDDILDFQESRQRKRNKRRRLQKERQFHPDDEDHHRPSHEVTSCPPLPPPSATESSPEQWTKEATHDFAPPIHGISSDAPSQAGPIVTTCLTPVWSSSHISSHDAYMTGCVFASLLSRLGHERILEEAHNRVYLMGQSTPLCLVPSAYTRISSAVEDLIQQRENHPPS